MRGRQVGEGGSEQKGILAGSKRVDKTELGAMADQEHRSHFLCSFVIFSLLSHITPVPEKGENGEAF